MKLVLAIGILLATTLGGCAVVPLDYGYRGEARYHRGDGHYRGDRYYRDYDSRRYDYGDHGQ
jgi:hypothetical protein